MTDVTDDDAPPPMTFEAYAAHIGTSRPYVSKLVKEGRIHGPALIPGPRAGSRLIVAAIADAQRAEAADPAHTTLPLTTESAYARERTALTAAQRQRAEMENATRRGELIERRAIAAIIPPAARRFRDALLQQVRDRITSDTERAALLADIATATETFIAEAQPDGGAHPA